MTASTCEQLCLGCSRCQYVSFNGRDCNWFAECDLAQLEESDGRSGWHTTRVRGEGSSDIVHNGTLLRNHTVVPTRSPCLHDRCASVAPSVSVFVVLDASARTVLANQKCEGFVKNLVRSACSQWDRPSPLLRPLMLDIGANSGYYSFVGAALGCRVVAFEPQRGCHQRIAAATQLNADLASDVHFLQAAVVPRSGRRVVRVPIVKEWSSGRREWREGCSVTSSSHRLAAPLDQRLPQRHHSQQKEERVQTASVREALVARGMHGPGDAIALAKVDAEGGELGVLREPALQAEGRRHHRRHVLLQRRRRRHTRAAGAARALLVRGVEGGDDGREVLAKVLAVEVTLPQHGVARCDRGREGQVNRREGGRERRGEAGEAGRGRGAGAARRRRSGLGTGRHLGSRCRTAARREARPRTAAARPPDRWSRAQAAVASAGCAREAGRPRPPGW